VIRTHGLTHIALAVADPQRSARFYRDVLGAEIVYDNGDFVQSQTPGSRDVLVFERATTAATRQGVGRSAGIAHFGFRLVDPADIHAAAKSVVEAGGKVTEQGDFCPGEPYLFATDPDGYAFEIWYELPTPLDPP